MRPFIGQIVHYKDVDQVCAAIVTTVWSDTVVNLQVFTLSGKIEFKTSVDYSDQYNVGNWTLPSDIG